MLEVARERPPEHIVFPSSAGMLYAGALNSADDRVPLRAHSYHGAGKIALEALHIGAFRTVSVCVEMASV